MAHPLIAFNQQNAAYLLANYLTSQHIPADVVINSEERNTNNEFIVVLQHAEHVDNAKSIAEDFLANPTNPKYQQAAWDSGKKSEAFFN